MKDLQNKVAIITGSSRGIGAEIARRLAATGAQVVINYVSRGEAAYSVHESIKASGGESLVVQADMRISTEVHRLFDETIEHFGRVDILINNAGVLIFKKLSEISNEEFDRVMDSNVKGVFYALREASTRLSDGGRVVTVSSTVTRMLLPKYGAYAASKGAIEQLTRVFAK
jgi:3-oxoacyl-[acyl-carrier protein] reductase